MSWLEFKFTDAFVAITPAIAGINRAHYQQLSAALAATGRAVFGRFQRGNYFGACTFQIV